STRLASVSVDGTVKIWDPSSGDCLQTFSTGNPVHNVSFDITNSYLHTEIGTIPLLYPAPISIPSEPFRPKYQGLSISPDGMWIRHNSESVLWLPSEYRPNHSVVSGKTVGMGTINGKVWICKVQLSTS
ncbi:hypothetical protein GQ43DRAFT_164696, partial [Delitschia confertaspora ATCC 74209]